MSEPSAGRELDIITPNELRAALEAMGWQFGEQSFERTGVDWYAWNWLSGVPDCTSNEKPPNLILTPWLHRDGWARVQFEVCGEVGDVWVKLEAYGVPMYDALKMLPRCEELLKAAWVAAANLPAALAASEADRATTQREA